MKYVKEINDFEKALDLDKTQVKRLMGAIEKSYNQEWHHEGPNIDQMNAIVAPYIKTQEEAFYVATVLVTDVLGAIADNSGKNPMILREENRKLKEQVAALMLENTKLSEYINNNRL